MQNKHVQEDAAEVSRQIKMNRLAAIPWWEDMCSTTCTKQIEILKTFVMLDAQASSSGSFHQFARGLILASAPSFSNNMYFHVS